VTVRINRSEPVTTSVCGIDHTDQINGNGADKERMAVSGKAGAMDDAHGKAGKNPPIT